MKTSRLKVSASTDDVCLHVFHQQSLSACLAACLSSRKHLLGWGSVFLRSRFVISVAILDSLQVVILALIHTSADIHNISVLIPCPSVGSFLHVFLGNLFTGTQDLVPLYSVFSFARSLYLLHTSMALLATAWHTSQAEAVARVFSFAYSWVEISVYSYAVLQSFTFLRRALQRSLNVRLVIKTWCIIAAGLGVAAALETLALLVV
jgi:hypothetical protein